MLYKYLILATLFVSVSYAVHKHKDVDDPCCSFPCQHSAVCMSRPKGMDYFCDCTDTGHYGKNCEHEYFGTWFSSLFKPSKSFMQFILTHFSLVWKFINNVQPIRKYLMRTVLLIRTSFVPEPTVYRGIESYPNWNGYINSSKYARTLPPVPAHCPTPMGVLGPKKLPDIDYMVERFLSRKKFVPCPRRTSLVFPFFAQHFTHQFFRTNLQKGMPFQTGGQGVNMETLYGNNLKRQSALRLHRGGKLKYQILNGEVFPPSIEEAKVFMAGADRMNETYRFAMGHAGFLMLPSFLVFQTVWLREHNRVCDIIKEENPYWNDERIFQAARLVIIGECIKVVIEDYVQHLSGFGFKLLYDPEILFGEGLPHYNQIHIEFDLLYHWHALMPDRYVIDNEPLTTRQFLFNPKPIVDAGIAKTFDRLSHQFAGKGAEGHNIGDATIHVAKMAMAQGRLLRCQSLNQYRLKFGLEPHKSFEDLVPDKDDAKELEEIYGDINAVEFYLGMFLEKRRKLQMFGETITEIGSPYSLKGLMGNPIGAKDWWKPSTFGGEKVFNIIKTTKLQDLVCRNVHGKCPLVSFSVPDGIDYNGPTVPIPEGSDDSAEILANIWGRKVHDPDYYANQNGGWEEEGMDEDEEDKKEEDQKEYSDDYKYAYHHLPKVVEEEDATSKSNDPDDEPVDIETDGKDEWKLDMPTENREENQHKEEKEEL